MLSISFNSPQGKRLLKGPGRDRGDGLVGKAHAVEDWVQVSGSQHPQESQGGMAATSNASMLQMWEMETGDTQSTLAGEVNQNSNQRQNCLNI